MLNRGKIWHIIIKSGHSTISRTWSVHPPVFQNCKRIESVTIDETCYYHAKSHKLLCFSPHRILQKLQHAHCSQTYNQMKRPGYMLLLCLQRYSLPLYIRFMVHPTLVYWYLLISLRISSPNKEVSLFGSSQDLKFLGSRDINQNTSQPSPHIVVEFIC